MHVAYEKRSISNNTRSPHTFSPRFFRICTCLYYWLKHHPNDLIHQETRERVATFLNDISLFPCLNKIYNKLLPLSSIDYFNSWRWQGDSAISLHSPVRTMTVNFDKNSESGLYGIPGTTSEQDLDEDREWGFYDEDAASPETKKCLSMNSPVSSSPTISAPSDGISTGEGVPPKVGHNRVISRMQHPHLARDRRSSTGSLAHRSPCAMETVVASRRGSASSLPSGVTHSSPLNPSYVPPSGDLAHQQQLQPTTLIPFITRRNSHAYRQKQAQVQLLQGMSLGGPWPQASVGGARNTSKDTSYETPVHPLQGGRGSPLPFADHMLMSTQFIDIKDATIAAQLTYVEFRLFKKLKVRRPDSDRVAAVCCDLSSMLT